MPVPLQLFVVPVDRTAETFDSDSLREIAAGLLQDVYECRAGSIYLVRSLPPERRCFDRPVMPRESKVDPNGGVHFAWQSRPVMP